MATNSNLEEKIDKLTDMVSTLSGGMESVKATIKEREKSEILRCDIISKTMEGIASRVEKLELNQNKVVWLIISIVITAVIGTVLVTKVF